jgi:aminotransferase EvaB
MTLIKRANFPQQDAIHYRSLYAKAIDEIIHSGKVILGPGVSSFEAGFSDWLGAGLPPSLCIGVASGTDALEMALRCAGVRAGDRVIMPSHTAYATVAALLRINALPVFVDVTTEGSVLCPLHTQEILERETGIKAVIAVHLYGESCDLSNLLTICKRHSVKLIEDCAQAIGTVYRNRKVGTWGDYAAFSFYPTKNLGAMGDGGALVINETSPADGVETARRMRCYGWNEHREAVQFGLNSRLDELQALILAGKLVDLDNAIESRRRIAYHYCERLRWLSERGLVTLPSDGECWRHSYHLFVVRIDPSKRVELLCKARQVGLPLAIHYPIACHQHAHIINLLGLSRNLPRTETLVSQVLSLPISPYLLEEDIESVVSFLEASLVN